MSFRTYSEVEGPDRSDLAGQVGAQLARVADRLARVRVAVAITSGKGGVGKSFVTAGLASALAARGRRVGVLDADLRSPTVARLLEAAGPLAVGEDGVAPARGRHGILVMSTDLLLAEGRPLAWRGPGGAERVWAPTMEAGVLREFLGDVVWGALDVLLLDLAPGTDLPAEVLSLVPRLSGAIAVTIPSDESRRSVARALRAAVDAGVPALGVVENMSGYRCAGCAATRPLFPGDAGDRLAAEFAVPLLARIPFTPDAASPPGGAAFDPIVAAVEGPLA